MPCRIPSHIFDIDEATAERLTKMNIRKRLLQRMIVLALILVPATAAVARLI